MPICRECHSTFPNEHMIPGNGPRHSICWNCAAKKGLVSKEDAEPYAGGDTARRTAVLARRLSPWVWLAMIWGIHLIVLSPVEPWGIISLVVALLSTVFVPIRQWLTLPRFQSEFANLKAMQ
ncbi:MAG TPA: hypothetical protein QF646_04770 [Candidatus Poseidoniales archaeon]|nr:hypothetical protein [Candidatus Poseidoniales archaeon]